MPATDLRLQKAPKAPFAKELSARVANVNIAMFTCSSRQSMLTEDLSHFAPSKSFKSSVRLRLPPPLQKEALAIYPSLLSFTLLFRFFLPFSDYHHYLCCTQRSVESDYLLSRCTQTKIYGII